MQVTQALHGFTPWAMVVSFAGGLLTSFSPCMLSMLPVLMGYVGGYAKSSARQGFFTSLAFVFGLGTTFAILGVVAASLGRVFGQIGAGWYWVMALVAILMGLQLLGVINIPLKGLEAMPFKGNGMPAGYLAGMLFGLVATPCATPVLAVIMTYVASQGELTRGAMVLFVYGLGHGTPLLLAGTFAASLKGLQKYKGFSRFVPYASGLTLIGFGFYLLVSHLRF